MSVTVNPSVQASQHPIHPNLEISQESPNRDRAARFDLLSMSRREAPSDGLSPKVAWRSQPDKAREVR